MKISKSYYIGLIISLTLLCFLEYNKRQEINWSKTFSTRDQMPYGTRVLFDMVSQGEWGDSLSRTNKTFYTISDKDSGSYFNLIYLAPNIHFDKESQKRLLQHISRGNRVLLVGTDISYKLMEEFALELKDNRTYFEEDTFHLNDNISFIDSIKTNKALTIYPYISGTDSIDNVQILGTQNGHPNFVKLTHGEGHLYIHVNPLLFSNYYLLKDVSFDYVNQVFSLLSNQPLVWDDYMNNGNRNATSELRYVLQSNAIRLAYYILLVLLFLYLGLAWRREQRVVPVIKAPRNNSTDFIETLTNLYLSNTNHGMIASYRIKAFKRKATKRYGIHWNKSPKLVKEQLLAKYEVSEEQADRLISIIYKTDIKNIDQSTLTKINHTLDDYTS